MTEHKNFTDDELNAIIAKEKKRARIGVIVCTIGIALSIGFYFHWDSSIENFDIENMTLAQNIIFFTTITIGIIGFAIQMIARSNAKDNAGTQIVEHALQEVFNSVEYLPKEHLPHSLIEQADMNFPFKYDRIGGSDLVQADYKGVNVTISDINLSDTRTSQSDIGRSNESVTVFEGLWMICDFKKKLSTELRIAERSKMGQSRKKNSVQTDSESFNKQFFINTENAHEAFYILTPHMMEFIQAMDNKAEGHTYMCLLREGKVHIAINSGRNSFEIDSLNTNVDKLRKRFISEIKYITDLIDELRLVDTFFEENVKNNIS